MEPEGNEAQYIPVWLTKEQWESIRYNLRFGSAFRSFQSLHVIEDAIEWAEGR